MVRQAWRFDEELSHSAWLRVLRGHRPPSVQWPKAGQQQERQTGLPRSAGRWRQQPRPHQGAVRQDHRQGQNFKPPEQHAAAARARIPQLEAALAALGNSTGPEVVALQQALKKARTDAEGVPVTTHSSSSWWNWQDSWWHSSSEYQRDDGPSTDRSGKPDRR